MELCKEKGKRDGYQHYEAHFNSSHSLNYQDKLSETNQATIIFPVTKVCNYINPLNKQPLLCNRNECLEKCASFKTATINK